MEILNGETAMMNSIGAEILLPGPFVVLQGMRGDGMANTIDSIPLYRPQGNSNSNNASADTNANANTNTFVNDHNTQATANQRGVGGFRAASGERINVNTEGPSGDDDTPDVQMDIHVMMDSKRNSQRHRRANNTSRQMHTSGSQSSGELVTSGDRVNVPQEITRVFPNDQAAAENSSEAGYHPSESAGESSDDALFYDDFTSSTSSVDPHAAGDADGDCVGVVTRNNMNRHCPVVIGDSAAIGSDGGLHLPIPPSAVVGMGYNTFLAHATPSQSDPQRNDDSFVLVQGNSNEQHSSNNNSNMISHIMNNSSANLSLSTSSSSIVDIARSFSSNNSSRYVNMMPHERHSIKQWNRNCRKREIQQRSEMQMYSNPQSRTRGAASAHHDRSQWWKMKSNCLAVFETLPSPADGKQSNLKDATSSTSATGTNTVLSPVRINLGKIVGELSPGCTVMGTEMIDIDRDTLQLLPSHNSTNNHITGISHRVGIYQFLRIESPLVGYVLFSIDGYTYLGSGLPSYYADPEVWTWRVTCPEGAFVRQGLELTSVQIDTIPYGAFVRVRRKTVNAMGLSRLQIEATVKARIVPSSSSSMLWNRTGIRGSFSVPIDSSIIEKKTSTKNIVGWISEALNPLSGQSGTIVQPIPLPVPVLYRVTLAEGAVIRADVELSSSRIGHAPMNAILAVVSRAYSNHPQDQCIERLQLTGGGGWVSLRLNRPPPRDELVLEMVGIDGSFDPNEPGLYHLEKQKQVIREYNENANTRATDQGGQDLSESLEPLNTNGEISSIEEGEPGNETVNGGEGTVGAAGLENSEISNATSSMTSVAGIPALYRSGVATGDRSVGSHTSVKGCGSKALADEMCLICLTEHRTATIVHGSTGHIACCLMCARILKGRGDRCPVCRLPIDSVIQQFWA